MPIRTAGERRLAEACPQSKIRRGRNRRSPARQLGSQATRRLMSNATTPLLTDLYQLNMVQAYLDHGKTDAAVFEFSSGNFRSGEVSWSLPGWSRSCTTSRP